MIVYKIKGWLKRTFGQTTKPEVATAWSKSDHVEKSKQSVIMAIVQSLSSLAGVSSIRNMTIWTNDAVLYQTLASPGAMGELATAFDNAELYALGKCHLQVRQGKPRCAAYTTVMKDMLYVTFGEEDAEDHGKERCTLYMVKDSGSMEKESYLLVSSYKELRYRIGRGQYVQRSGLSRVNDIVIKNDEEDTDLKERNMHVSSNQADIVTVDGKFYLQAMSGGCSNMDGTATKILRNGQANKLVDIFTRHRLYDGDIIEMGRKVCLEVHIEKAE